MATVPSPLCDPEAPSGPSASDATRCRADDPGASLWLFVREGLVWGEDAGDATLGGCRDCWCIAAGGDDIDEDEGVYIGTEAAWYVTDSLLISLSPQGWPQKALPVEQR